MSEETRSNRLRELTADIVVAFVGNNAIPVAGLPDLIASVNATLLGLGSLAPAPNPAPVPAVDPKKSIGPNHIICLEDGKKFKSLKRHLGVLGLTPDAYRSKWGLPRNYPMVAPNYSKSRSAIAKATGLGLDPVKKARTRKA
ncbi:MAG: MucR family transcriptional regulator [Mesorhizobium sp.]